MELSLIDPEGRIKLAEINDNGIGRNSDELLARCRRLNSLLLTRAKFALLNGIQEKAL